MVTGTCMGRAAASSRTPFSEPCSNAGMDAARRRPGARPFPPGGSTWRQECATCGAEAKKSGDKCHRQPVRNKQHKGFSVCYVNLVRGDTHLLRCRAVVHRRFRTQAVLLTAHSGGCQHECEYRNYCCFSFHIAPHFPALIVMRCPGANEGCKLFGIRRCAVEMNGAGGLPGQARKMRYAGLSLSSQCA